MAGVVVLRRIAVIRAAVTMADLQHVPGRFHQLTGNRAGAFAFHVSPNWRLLIAPEGETSFGPGGGLDLGGVTAVRVLGVLDYHGE